MMYYHNQLIEFTFVSYSFVKSIIHYVYDIVSLLKASFFSVPNANHLLKVVIESSCEESQEIEVVAVCKVGL